jgi:hypothetical protein
VSHRSNTVKAASPLYRRGVWLALGVVLVGALGLSSLTRGRDGVPVPRKEASRSALADTQMIIRGPDQPMVGQRFTLEVLILNAGTTPLKDLEFQATLDASLEQASRAREHREEVEAIAPDDLHIARLTVTPRKNGPCGVDLTLRAKNGDTEQVRHVWPVLPEDPSARQPAPAEGTPPLKFTIKPLKKCFADRPAIVLIHVLNTDSKPMPGKLDLTVSYAAMGRGGHMINGPGAPFLMEDLGHSKGESKQLALIAMSNPTRTAQVSLPVLGPGEGRTLPIRITPKRIGDLGIAISASPKSESPQVLATARLPVAFDPTMPVEKLLPVRAAAGVPSRLPQKLADVPEVSLEDPHARGLSPTDGFEHVGHLIETINHVNARKTDAYMEALVSKRSDMQGLPFAMGDACRLSTERGQHFLTELTALRSAMGNPAALASQLPNPTAQPNGEVTIQARIRALVQVVGPEGSQLGQQMVKYLATLPHVDATRALAQLAIFAEEDQVRRDAVAALAVRRDKDSTDVLRDGLSYPWPAVAQRSAEAIARLKRVDLLPQLVEVLERPDPRAPQVREKEGKKVTVVRELVRINHLRNCLLCHSPASSKAATVAIPGEGPATQVPVEALGGRGLIAGPGTLTAPVPLPGQEVPTPTPHNPYGQFSVPDTLLAFDVTYLRQDFSVKLPVADAKPWPDTQRFDFLVRTREVTEPEAQAYRDLLRPAQAGDLSPYQRAALASLRQLTGKDAEPTAAAWRRVLEGSKAEKN